jgi:hypothetical protein
MCIGLGFLMLWGSRLTSSGAIDPRALGLLGLYGVVLAATHLILVLIGSRADPLIVVAVAFLAGFGMLAQVRLGGTVRADGFDLDLVLLPVGFALMVLIVGLLQQGRYQMLAAPWVFWAAASLSIGVLAALLLLGERYRGGVYGFGLITPAEVLKLTVLVFVGGFVEHYASVLSGTGRARAPCVTWSSRQ